VAARDRWAYQWRGIFLTAARQLRQGVLPAVLASAGEITILPMPIGIPFDFAAVHVIGEEAAKVDIRIDFAFTDHDETWTVWVKREVLNARHGTSKDTLLTVSGPKAALVGVVLRPSAASQLAHARKISLDGDELVPDTLAGLMDACWWARLHPGAANNRDAPRNPPSPRSGVNTPTSQSVDWGPLRRV
jgi:alkyl sulfatase BDS1-like metallo-beta-lactamase superfamily hydrolase